MRRRGGLPFFLFFSPLLHSTLETGIIHRDGRNHTGNVVSHSGDDHHPFDSSAVGWSRQYLYSLRMTVPYMTAKPRRRTHRRSTHRNTLGWKYRIITCKSYTAVLVFMLTHTKHTNLACCRYLLCINKL